MKRCRLFPLFLVLMAFSLGCSGKRVIERLEKKSLPQLQEPKVQEVKLSNGMTCFLLEDHTLPMIRAEAVVRVGSIHETSEKRGLASLMGAVMKSGGTEKSPPEEFERTLDSFGLIITNSVNKEQGKATLQTLSKEKKVAFESFVDMLFRPRFDPQRLEIERQQFLEDLRREEDKPERVADREFRKIVYGEESPWARRPTETTLKSIGREEMVAFHRHYYVPQNTLLAIAGDFSTPKLISLLEQFMEGLPNETPLFPAVKPVEEHFQAATISIPKPLTQSYIRLGHLGIKRDNPDKYALFLMNQILGGGSFNSRLMDDIRTRRGLTYGISSGFYPETDFGLFKISFATKVESGERALQLVKGHLDDLVEKGVTEKELQFAQSSILNRQIFSIDNAFKIVSQRSWYRFYGYPDDYSRVYREEIQKVTREEVNRVSRRYLHPEALKIVIVGGKRSEKH